MVSAHGVTTGYSAEVPGVRCGFVVKPRHPFQWIGVPWIGVLLRQSCDICVIGPRHAGSILAFVISYAARLPRPVHD